MTTAQRAKRKLGMKSKDEMKRCCPIQDDILITAGVTIEYVTNCTLKFILFSSQRRMTPQNCISFEQKPPLSLSKLIFLPT